MKTKLTKSKTYFFFGIYHRQESLVYEWQGNEAVTIVHGMTLSQFDLISKTQSNYTYKRREGDFSVVQISFNLQRHTGYFLIQVIPSLSNL